MRKFLIKISYTVLPFWLLLVGFATYLWMTDDKSGDLMRLGLINDNPEYTDSIKAAQLPEVYYTGIDTDSLMRQDTTSDVVVIGDSFSHGGGIGKNGDYVNYLAHDGKLKVVVFTPLDPAMASPMQIAYDALKLGVLDSVNAKNLVVQEGERYLVGRHCDFVTTHTEVPHSKPQESKTEDKKQEASPLLRVKDFVFYHLFGVNPIYHAQLDRPLFGGSNPQKLYFYSEDVELFINVTDAQRQMIVNCFKRVIDMAQEKGVNLIILLACDKYDLYQDHIVDNPYPTKTLNEDIAQWMAADMDRFVIAKQVFQPLVEQGVKDVYLYNDTHWSPSSSRLIAGEVIKKLK